MLSIMKTSADVGIYNVAYKVLENITFFPSMLVGLVFPIMAQSIFHDRARFEDISNKTFKVFAVLVVPQAAGGPDPARRYRIWCDPSFGPFLSETLGAVVVESGRYRGVLNGVKQRHLRLYRAYAAAQRAVFGKRYKNSRR